MFNDFMWQRFFVSGKISDYLLCREAEEEAVSDEDEYLQAKPQNVF